MKLEWSPEAAGTVYMHAVKVLEEHDSATDVAEFLAALAGGWKAQLILEAPLPGDSVATSLGLRAAAERNGGRHMCILPDPHDAEEYTKAMGDMGTDLVAGNASELVDAMEGVDFAVVDWRREDASAVLRAVRPGPRGAVIVCRDVGEPFSGGARWRERLREGIRLVRTALLPIGKGLEVLHVGVGEGPCLGDHSRWIKQVDSHTGEEHVFRR